MWLDSDDDDYKPTKPHHDCPFCSADPQIAADTVIRAAEDTMLREVALIGITATGHYWIGSNVSCFDTTALFGQAITRIMHGGADGLAPVKGDRCTTRQKPQRGLLSRLLLRLRSLTTRLCSSAATTAPRRERTSAEPPTAGYG